MLGARPRELPAAVHIQVRVQGIEALEKDIVTSPALSSFPMAKAAVDAILFGILLIVLGMVPGVIVGLIRGLNAFKRIFSPHPIPHADFRVSGDLWLVVGGGVMVVAGLVALVAGLPS